MSLPLILGAMAVALAVGLVVAPIVWWGCK